MRNDKRNPLLPTMVEGDLSNRWTDISPRPDFSLSMVQFPTVHNPAPVLTKDEIEEGLKQWLNISPMPDFNKFNTDFPIVQHGQYYDKSEMPIEKNNLLHPQED